MHKASQAIIFNKSMHAFHIKYAVSAHYLTFIRVQAYWEELSRFSFLFSFFFFLFSFYLFFRSKYKIHPLNFTFCHFSPLNFPFVILILKISIRLNSVLCLLSIKLHHYLTQTKSFYTLVFFFFF